MDLRFQPLIIIGAAFVGLVSGYYSVFSFLKDNAAGFIEAFLMALLYFVFLSVDLRGLRNSFRHFKFAFSSLVINFIWTPVFAFILGWFFLGDIDLRIGFLMLMATPCTDWYLVFTGLAKGNVELGASILPMNLVLQVALLPVYLLIFFGKSVQFDAQSIIASIVMVLLVPFALARASKALAAKTGAIWAQKKIFSRGEFFQLIFLCLAVIAMFASESEPLIANPRVLLTMLIPLAIFFVVNFLLALFVSRWLKFPFRDTVALNMTTLARNSPLSLAIAVAAFPDHPLILLALVVGPLIELPVLTAASSVLLKMKKDCGSAE
jgi:ACR3 family arsenite efflux pump ArsB